MKTYEIRTTTNKGTYNSGTFSSLWAINHIAVNFIENYNEVEKVEVIDKETKETIKTYTRG